jgi:hypothetical protein
MSTVAIQRYMAAQCSPRISEDCSRADHERNAGFTGCAALSRQKLPAGLAFRQHRVRCLRPLSLEDKPIAATTGMAAMLSIKVQLAGSIWYAQPGSAACSPGESY